MMLIPGCEAVLAAWSEEDRGNGAQISTLVLGEIKFKLRLQVWSRVCIRLVGEQMLKLVCKIRVNRTVRAKCDRHPSYDPATVGKDQIIDRCATCWNIHSLYESNLTLDVALREFERRAAAWDVLTERKRAARVNSKTNDRSSSGPFR